jgi:hypothetical protein
MNWLHSMLSLLCTCFIISNSQKAWEIQYCLSSGARTALQCQGFKTIQAKASVPCRAAASSRCAFLDTAALAWSENGDLIEVEKTAGFRLLFSRRIGFTQQLAPAQPGTSLLIASQDQRRARE